MWWLYVIIGVAVGLIDFTVGFRAGHRHTDEINRPVFQGLLDDLKQTTRERDDARTQAEWLRTQQSAAEKALKEMSERTRQNGEQSIKLVPDTLTTQLVRPDTVIAAVRVSAQYDGETWTVPEIRQRFIKRLGEEALGRAHLNREHDLVADEYLYTARVDMMPLEVDR